MKDKTAKETKKKDKKNSPADALKLQNQIESLTREKNELFEKLQRISADYANHQKRTPKQIADSVAYEKKAMLRTLLPSLDNFEHALAAAKTAKTVEEVTKGIELIFQHMLGAIKTQGVEQINATGEEFNPAVHEAVMQRTEEDKPANVVLEEFQKGYTLNGQVLRPSKVIVNKLPALPQDDDNEEE